MPPRIIWNVSLSLTLASFTPVYFGRLGAASRPNRIGPQYRGDRQKLAAISASPGTCHNNLTPSSITSMSNEDAVGLNPLTRSRHRWPSSTFPSPISRR
jgi:hypothetical protein